MRQAILPPVEALFRVLFEYDCVGEEHVPAEGPAIVAANHPSYLDPILLSLQVPRPIRFMAWDALFRVPLLGAVIRAFGAFPVDTRRGQGHEAYAEAKALVEAGEVVGIFPEGRRSTAGWMEPRLREGAARLAYETGAPLVPATITGAFRAWPHFQPLPQPARIRVRFHEPIDPAPFRALPEEQAIEGLLAELRRRVERTLLPGVKADLRTTVLYASPAPWPRPHEALPAFGLVLLVFWKTRSWTPRGPRLRLHRLPPRGRPLHPPAPPRQMDPQRLAGILPPPLWRLRRPEAGAARGARPGRPPRHRERAPSSPTSTRGAA